MAECSGKYNHTTGRIRLNPNLKNNPAQLALTLVHETGHALWDALPESARGKVRQHFKERIGEEAPSMTRNGRKYFRDKWPTEFAGLEDGSEVLPYHLEMLALSPEKLIARLQKPEVRKTLEILFSAIGIEPAPTNQR